MIISQNNKKKLAFFLCILNAIIFSFHFFAVKDILKTVDPLAFAAIRGILGGLILLLILKKESFLCLTKKNFFDIAIIAFLGFCINQVFFMYGLKESTPLNASIIMNTIPITTTFMAIIFALEVFTWRKIIGILIGLVLVLFLAFQGKNSGMTGQWGDIMIFLNVVSFCLAITLSKKIIDNKIPPIVLSTGMILFGGLMLYTISFHKTPSFIQYTFLNSRNFWIMFFEVVVSTSVAYYINFKTLQILLPSQTMIFIYIQPPFTALIEYFLWGKIPSFLMIPVFFGIMLSGYLVLKVSPIIKKEGRDLAA